MAYGYNHDTHDYQNHSKSVSIFMYYTFAEMVREIFNIWSFILKIKVS